MTLTKYAIKILFLTLNLQQLTAAVKTFTFLCIYSPLLMWINAIRLWKCKGTINIQVLNVIALTLSSQLFYPSCSKIVNLKTVSIFFCVSQNNFISGTVVDSVDEYVFVLYSNRIFILHYLSLERIVCYSIRLVSLGFVKSPKHELCDELS